MKAVLWKGNHTFEFGRWEQPKLEAGQVLLKVRAASICTTDLHYADFDCVPPIVPGHEVSGEIIELGPDVRGVSLGDRVTVNPVQTCGACPACTGGIPHLCQRARHLGNALYPGGWAEYLAIDARNTYPIPDNVPFDVAALTEPAAVCLESFKRAAFRPGRSVLIFGDGTFGYLHAQWAQILQAGTIIVAGHYDRRLERIRRKTGALTCNTHHEDLTKMLRDTLGDYGADLAVEVTGAGPAPNICLEALRPRGTLILFSYVWHPEILNLGQIHMNELNVLGACRSLDCYPECIDAAARGSLDLADLIDVRVPLEGVAEALEKLRAQKADHFKAVFLPESEV